MTRSTFKVLFYLKKGAENSNGETMIMARITLNGVRCNFSTKQKIKTDSWNVDGNKAIGRSSEVNQINNLLDKIKSSLMSIYQEMLLTDNYVTAEKVRNAFMGNGESCATILSLFDKHNDDVKSLVGISKSAATLQKYGVTRRHISEFIRHKYNVADMYINEINAMFVNDFDVYLRTIACCGANTTAKFLQFFKRIVIIARDNGMMKADPFANYKIRIEKVDRGYLSQAEVNKIVKKKLCSERLEQVRDIFIFACFSGLAYIDVKNLTDSNIKTMFDGKKWIITKRQKTNTKVEVPLLTIPERIIKKYRGKAKDNLLLPVISNQKLNSYLKEIGDVCGIEQKLTFHLARHTFATTTTLANGIPIETVSKMLGHTNISTTQIYARITNDKISKDMKDLSDKFAETEDMYKTIDNKPSIKSKSEE
ncbi:MAG: site-specific integrase [Rikenellaceae bacterium]